MQVIETIAKSESLPAGFTHKSKIGLYKWSVSLKRNFGGGQNLRNSTKDTKYDKQKAFPFKSSRAENESESALKKYFRRGDRSEQKLAARARGRHCTMRTLSS